MKTSIRAEDYQYKSRGLKEVDICRAPMDLSKGCDMWGTRAG